MNGTAKVTPSAVTVTSDTAVTLAVPAIAPAAADQSVVYSVAYTTGSAVNATAYTVAKIPAVAVKSVTALNLKQVQVVFNKKVDQTTAELTTNYLEDSAAIAACKAELQADGMTVLITFTAAKAQQAAIAYTVKNVKSADLTETVATTTMSASYLDTTTPSVAGVVVNGNTQIVVTFNEPIVNGNLASSYKLDGYDLSAFGISSVAYTDTTAPSKQTSVTMNFGVALPAGTHTLTVKASSVSDPAGFFVVATDKPAVVIADTAEPIYVSSVSNGLGTLDITFSKPIQLPTITNIYVNGVALTNAATIGYKDTTGTDKTVIEITKTSLLSSGANLVTMAKSTLTDYYGNTNSTTAVRFTVAAASDTTAPTLAKVVASSDTLLYVTFSEAMDTSARNPANYVIKNAAGTAVGTISTVTADATQSYTYDLNLASALPGGVYTVTVANSTDLAGNAVATATKSVVITDTTAPSAPTATLISASDNIVKVSFSEAMDYASIADRTHYQADITNSGTYSPLDSTVVLTVAADNKSVTLNFPETTPITPGTSTIRTLLVKDAAGNFTAAIANSGIAVAPTSNLTPAFLRAKATSTTSLYVEYDHPLASISAADFKFAGTAANNGVLQNLQVYAADGVTLIDGARITLTWNSATIPTNAAGNLTTIAAGIATQDSLGNKIAAGITKTVSDKVAPKISSVFVKDATTVDVVFSENIQPGYGSLYMNDFTVTNGGAGMTIDSSSVVNNNTIELVLDSNLQAGQTTVVTPKSTITYAQDVAGNKYVPSTTDLNGLSDVAVPTVVTGVTTKMLTATTFQITFNKAVTATAADFTAYAYDADAAGVGAPVAINVTSIAGSGTNTITVTTAANAGFATGVGTATVNIGAGVKDLAGNAITPVVAQVIAHD